MSEKHMLLLDAPCPICPRLFLQKVAVRRDDVENKKRLKVFSPTCGHVWELPPDTAIKMKEAMQEATKEASASFALHASYVRAAEAIHGSHAPTTTERRPRKAGLTLIRRREPSEKPLGLATQV
jgi:hypothetical protein